MCLVAWYLLFEICRLFLCLRYNQNLLFFCAFHIIRIYKKFLFVFVVYYFTMLFLWFFLVYLRWVFIISLFAVGSEEVAVGDIIIFKNLGVWGDGLLCLLCFILGVFFIRRLCGLFVVAVFVIDFTIDWREIVFVFVLTVCFLVVFDWEILDCLLWLFLWLIVPVGCFLLNGCDFVRKKKNYGRTVHCNAAVVNLCQKECALIQTVDLLIWTCIVCCENVFLFWTSFCEWYKLNRLLSSDGYYSCVEENAAGCSALF